MFDKTIPRILLILPKRELPTLRTVQHLEGVLFWLSWIVANSKSVVKKPERLLDGSK